MNKNKYFTNFIKGSLTVLFSVLVVYGVVQAGTTIVPPSSTPTVSLYTLSDIWTRLTTNATATEGGHLFTFADPLAGTHVTLTQIYNAIPTIDATKLLDNTTYLGITGNIATQTLDPLSKNVLAGYYIATTLDAVDTDLASGNIKKGVNLFGIDGDVNVVDTSLGDAIASDILNNKIAFVDGLQITGTFASQEKTALVDGEITPDAGKWLSKVTVAITNLVDSVIKKGETVGGVIGALLPSGGDAVAGNVLADKTFFGASQTNWTLKTGTMINKVGTATVITPSTADQAIAQGYYGGVVGDGKVLGDPDLTATSIGADINIFGVTGTLLKNLYNGSASTGDYPGAGAVGDVGGVDDYNAGGARPATSYAKTWTDCTASPYCGTDSNADKKDDSTGLIWSKWLYAGVAKTWFYANNCLYPNGLGDGVCDTHNEAACKCVKLTGTGEGGNGEKTGCDALGNGWRLPYQKELMQAYIDGSWNSPANLSNAGYYYWSATTNSNATQLAWYTYLFYGYTNYYLKSSGTSYRVRCVR